MATNSNLTFDYKRQNNFDEPAEDPGIRSFEVYGELADIREDPEWMKTRLYGIYNDVEPLLNALQERSKGVTSLALAEYRPEVQEQKRIAHIKEPFERILTLIKSERERSRKAVQNLEERILKESSPARPADIGERLSMDSFNAEIRMLIRSQDNMQDRIRMVNNALANGDSSFLKPRVRYVKMSGIKICPLSP